MKTPTISQKVSSPSDDCDSAKILINEGLVEEAKKLLFRLLANHPNYGPAKKILKEINEIELKEIFNSQSGRRNNVHSGVEDVDQIISKLDQDLELNVDSSASEKPDSELFLSTAGLTPKEYLDLAIGFMEMDCYSDALRELYKAEKLIRTQETFLGKTGIMAASLIAQCLVKLGRAYEAKNFLSPVLTEPDLAHEDKVFLYYEMGCIEQELGGTEEAIQWLRNVMKIDPLFKDTQYRLKVLIQKHDT